MNHKQLVLEALKQGEAYAPEIRDRIEAKHGKHCGLFRRAVGPVYMSTHRLLADGAILLRVDHNSAAERGGSPRHYYRLK